MAPGLAPMTTAPRWPPCHRQLGVVGQVAWGLGANANDAKLCYLGASVDDVKSWIYFLKSFCQGAYLRSVSSVDYWF
jgi:hypothetical protein